MNSAAPIILVASDNQSEANDVAGLLCAEFEHVVVSIDPRQIVIDYLIHQPQILVLAFSSLPRAEQYCVALYREGNRISPTQHQSILLCDRHQLRRVYEWCRQQVFDDYVPFWPHGDDPARLLIAVHQAVRRAGPRRAVTATAGLPAPVNRVAPALAASHWLHGTTAEPLPARRPLLSALERIPPPRVTAPAPRNQPASSVLVVEDDELQRQLLGQPIWGANVHLCFNRTGQEALAHLGVLRPDLILMDIDLPDGSGLDFTWQLKNTPVLADIPIVLLTTHSESALVQQMLQAGAADYVVKPLEREVLSNKLRQWLPQRRGRMGST